MQGPMAFLLESHQLVADLRGERKFGMIEGMKLRWKRIDMKKEKSYKYRIGTILVFAVCLLLVAGCESKKKIEKVTKIKSLTNSRSIMRNLILKTFNLSMQKMGLWSNGSLMKKNGRNL